MQQRNRLGVNRAFFTKVFAIVEDMPWHVLYAMIYAQGTRHGVSLQGGG